MLQTRISPPSQDWSSVRFTQLSCLLNIFNNYWTWVADQSVLWFGKVVMPLRLHVVCNIPHLPLHLQHELTLSSSPLRCHQPTCLCTRYHQSARGSALRCHPHNFAIDVCRNVCHGSDSVKNAKKEIALWFKEGEVQSWKSAQHDWVYEM